MSDHMKKVKASDDLQIPAPAYNAFIDAAQDFKNRTQNMGSAPHDEFCQTGIVLVKNNSGSDCDRFGVLGIDEPIFTPTDNLNEFKNNIALKGITPSANGRFVIVIEPIANGKIGMAVVSGICVVKINVPDTIAAGWQYADGGGGLTCLEIKESPRSAHILWKESGPGVKWAVVRLSNQYPLCQNSAYDPRGDLNDENKVVPEATDITGDPSNANHYWAMGYMYQDSSGNWNPWLPLNQAQGPPGTDGIDGTDGTNGTNGTDGIDGTDGVDGYGFTAGDTNGQIKWWKASITDWENSASNAVSLYMGQFWDGSQYKPDYVRGHA